MPTPVNHREAQKTLQFPRPAESNAIEIRAETPVPPVSYWEKISDEVSREVKPRAREGTSY